MGEKKKVLFIVNDFIQAGAQRYQYEIIKALNKDKYQIDVYVLSPLGSQRKNGFDKDYYYPLLQQLTNNIVFYDQFIGHLAFLLRIMKSIHNRFFVKVPYIKDISLKLIQFIESNNKKPLKQFLDSYDIVNVADYLFYKVSDVLTINKLYVHVMTSKMQTFPKSPFDAFDYEKRYNFVVDWTQESESFEFLEFRNGYNNVRVPLILDTTKFNTVKYSSTNNPYKIGIFTRIDYQIKPLDPFFFALHLLVNQGMKIQLYIFGAGKPDGFNRLIKMLSLQEYVHFEGHQEDLGGCLEKYKLNLVWFQANNYQPGGYAAYEIMLREVPNVFWDFQPLNKANIQGKQPLPFFWDVEKLVVHTKFLLENTKAAKELGEIQRQYVIEHQDSKKFIHLLEAAFDKKN